MSKRGIVIGLRAGQNSLSGSVEIQDLLRWILYWDKIIYAGVTVPGGASISGNPPKDIAILEQEEIFKMELIDLTTLSLPDLPEPEPGMKVFGLASNQFQIANSAARLQLSSSLTSSSEIWTIGQTGGESLLLPGNRHIELVDIQLVDCLPVPIEGTPFEDVLEFKQRYEPELQILRRHLDELREKVLASVDERREIEKTLQDLSKASLDLKRALNGRNINSVSEAVSIYTGNPSFGFWSAIGGAAAGSIGAPVEIGIAAGGAAATTFRFIGRSLLGTENQSNFDKEFSYLYQVTQNFKTK